MRALDPEDLFEIDSDRPDLTGAVLIHLLDGFVDAGSTVGIIRSHLLDSADSHLLVRFDVDQLFDYRARRPLMQFKNDTWTSYHAPELAIHLLHDVDGVPFLVLAGPEPDVQWERFAAAVRLVVERLGVRLVVGMNAFPMSVPHTRPTPVIVHGSRRDLFADYRPWLGAVAVPASIGHLLEYRLGGVGIDALGLAAPVPPYLAAGEYPTASLALLREAGARTGLHLALGDLEDTAATNRIAIDGEAAKSEEVQTMVTALEQQYDANSWGSAESLLATDAGDLPSADELGAELERFLADRSKDDGTG
jgi:PAC2 family protein